MAKEREIDLGTPGGSAKREHEQRRARREAKTREHHPHLGNLLLRVQSAPTSEAAWETGATGEEILAAHLAKTCPEVTVLLNSPGALTEESCREVAELLAHTFPRASG